MASIRSIRRLRQEQMAETIRCRKWIDSYGPFMSFESMAEAVAYLEGRIGQEGRVRQQLAHNMKQHMPWHTTTPTGA